MLRGSEKSSEALLDPRFVSGTTLPILVHVVTILVIEIPDLIYKILLGLVLGNYI
jgi:hypothetical protein